MLTGVTSATGRDPRRRVIMTGIGVVAPGSIGVAEFWELLTSGRTATRAITTLDASSFRSRVAGECDFDPRRCGLSPADVERLGRPAQFAVAAAREALDDSGLDLGAVVPHRVGVSLGSAVGGIGGLDRAYPVVSHGAQTWEVDHACADPQLSRLQNPSWMACEVAWTARAEGPVRMISTACSTGVDAVSHGCELIREGLADVVIAGASDAAISPIILACFDAIRATSAHNDDPAGASRPFDRTRDGLVLGEGAAVFVLEELEHARRRGAPMRVEIGGWASRCNAFHMTGLRPDGREMAEAIRAAMHQAGVGPDDIDSISAHGSATPQNDRHETAAYKASLGPRAYEVPVSAIKSMIGHSLGAAGAIELAASALMIQHGVVPPTANLCEPDPDCDLDYVPLSAREHRSDAVLSVASGWGGFQSAAVLTRAA